jgi:hypothetical protein
MPLFSCPFRVERLTLLAGTPTPITPPLTCSSVAISNITGGDLKVASDQNMTEYFTLPNCFERDIELSQSGSATSLFHQGQVNFYLQADQQGEVVLLWT